MINEYINVLREIGNKSLLNNNVAPKLKNANEIATTNPMLISNHEYEGELVGNKSIDYFFFKYF